MAAAQVLYYQKHWQLGVHHTHTNDQVIVTQYCATSVGTLCLASCASKGVGEVPVGKPLDAMPKKTLKTYINS